MQIVFFIVAGYETTSTTLAYCSHLLALHPAIQTKAQEEIDRIVGQNVSLLRMSSVKRT